MERRWCATGLALGATLALGACATAAPAGAPEPPPAPAIAPDDGTDAGPMGRFGLGTPGVTMGPISPFQQPMGGNFGGLPGGVSTPPPAGSSNGLPAPPAAGAMWTASQVGQPLLPFATNQEVLGPGGYDVYMYNPKTGTVYGLPGANTPGQEVQPRMSAGGRYMVYTSSMGGPFQVYRYDLMTQALDPLKLVNDAAVDQISPSIDDAGRFMTYLVRVGGLTQLRMADLATGVVTAPAPIAQLGPVALTPRISGDGQWVAFSGDTGRGADIYLYRVGSGSVYEPPFVNSSASEIDPALSPDGTHMLFASNRSGLGYMVYDADMTTGFLDNLSVANAFGDNVAPVYLDATGRDFAFVSNRAGVPRQFMFHRTTGVVDTLPLYQDPGELALVGQGATAVAGGATANSGLGGYAGIGGYQRGRIGGYLYPGQ